MTRPVSMFLSRLLPLAAALALAGAAAAQVPPDIAAQLRAIGRKVDPVGTGKIYGPLQQHEPYKGVKITRDIAYGADPKETLDLVLPAAASAGPRPVMIFIHGGAYVGGDKNKDGQGRPSPFYDNIMLWSVAHGMIGVNMNYPLAPKAQYPTVQKDIAKVIAWVQANAARNGGDPKRVFLWGHSAGAAHVATFVSHPEFYPPGGSGLTGAIMSSAIFVVEPSPDGKPNPYFGGDTSKYPAMSSIKGLVATKLPLFMTYAELDPQGFHDNAAKLKAAMCAAGHCPAHQMMLKDESHMSESYSVNTADQQLTGPLAAWLKNPTK